jgi:hypothetical protein
VGVAKRDYVPRFFVFGIVGAGSGFFAVFGFGGGFGFNPIDPFVAKGGDGAGFLVLFV